MGRRRRLPQEGHAARVRVTSSDVITRIGSILDIHAVPSLRVLAEQLFAWLRVCGTRHDVGLSDPWGHDTRDRSTAAAATTVDPLMGSGAVREPLGAAARRRAVGRLRGRSSVFEEVALPAVPVEDGRLAWAGDPVEVAPAPPGSIEPPRRRAGAAIPVGPGHSRHRLPRGHRRGARHDRLAAAWPDPHAPPRGLDAGCQRAVELGRGTGALRDRAVEVPRQPRRGAPERASRRSPGRGHRGPGPTGERPAGGWAARRPAPARRSRPGRWSSWARAPRGARWVSGPLMAVRGHAVPEDCDGWHPEARGSGQRSHGKGADGHHRTR
jgi:hypothetical protein